MLPAGLWAVTHLHVPVDQDAMKQAEAAVREAQQEGNPAATLRAYHRWLEFYPNEPIVQAGIYRAMALLAGQNGDADQARQWNDVANNLVPAVDQRIDAGGSTTRGASDGLTTAMTALTQTVQLILTTRQALQVPQRLGMPLAAQPPVAFPQQPVGAPGFPPQPGTQPMPGYSAQPLMGGQPVPVNGPQAQLVGQPVPVQPMVLDAQGNPLAQIAVQPAAQPLVAGLAGSPIPQPAPGQYQPPVVPAQPGQYQTPVMQAQPGQYQPPVVPAQPGQYQTPMVKPSRDSIKRRWFQPSRDSINRR